MAVSKAEMLRNLLNVMMKEDALGVSGILSEYPEVGAMLFDDSPSGKAERDARQAGRQGGREAAKDIRQSGGNARQRGRYMERHEVADELRKATALGARFESDDVFMSVGANARMFVRSGNLEILPLQTTAQRSEINGATDVFTVTSETQGEFLGLIIGIEGGVTNLEQQETLQASLQISSLVIGKNNLFAATGFISALAFYRGGIINNFGGIKGYVIEKGNTSLSVGIINSGITALVTLGALIMPVSEYRG